MKTVHEGHILKINEEVLQVFCLMGKVHLDRESTSEICGEFVKAFNNSAQTIVVS